MKTKPKIGLVGEDPNDTDSIINLLSGKYPNTFQFKKLIKLIRGSQLDNARTHASLKIEFDDYKPDYVLFIRDADGLPSEQDKLDKIKSWFNKLNGSVNKKGILLINIYELEALILADIGTFNKLYKTSIKYAKSCMHQEKPKEFLIQKTSKNNKVYSESHCPGIFEHLSYDVLVANCAYFKEFDTSLKKLIIN
jgi:Domain of unknown function (DUF4276)